MKQLEKLLGCEDSMATTKKLNEQQKAFVEAYCNADNESTFLNHVGSFHAAGYKESSGKATNALKTLNKPHIKEEIRKQMPDVAYNAYILRKEYWELFDKAKSDKNYNVAAKLLDSMAKTERMFNNNQTNDSSEELRIKRAAEEATKNTFAKIAKEKEARASKIISLNKDATANG